MNERVFPPRLLRGIVQALRDPLHRTIALEDWAVDLIDAREMQRLRRIRQLGTAHLVYPGANHTRFEHSLGACKLAQDVGRVFGLETGEARALQAAALLHDVGHGPMSHLFEEAVAPHHRHEQYGVDLIRWSGLADRLRSAGVDPKKVAGLIQGQGANAALVTGDIDVDRMDYLVRDAYYTGLRVSVDPERILQTLTFQDGRLLVREEGVTAVEALLLARFLMYPAVYFHHACRAAEAMVVAAVQRVVADGAPVADLRDLDDAGLLRTLDDAAGFAQDVATRIDERRLYKRAYEGTHATVAANPFLQELVSEPRHRRDVEAEIAAEAHVEASHVLVDAPRPPLAREVQAGVLRKEGDVVPLTQLSTLVRNLLNAQMDHWRFWVFAPKDSLSAVHAAFERRLEAKSVKPSPR